MIIIPDCQSRQCPGPFPNSAHFETEMVIFDLHKTENWIKIKIEYQFVPPV